MIGGEQGECVGGFGEVALPLERLSECEIRHLEMRIRVLAVFAVLEYVLGANCLELGVNTQRFKIKRMFCDGVTQSESLCESGIGCCWLVLPNGQWLVPGPEWFNLQYQCAINDRPHWLLPFHGLSKNPQSRIRSRLGMNT